MRQLLFLAAVLAIAACAPSALADPPSLRATLGLWRLSEVGGKVGCTLTLTDAPGIGGLEVKAPLACRGAFPALKAVSTWAFDADGAIVFSDPSHQRIVVFHAHGGAYDAAAADGKVWRLEPAQASRPAAAPLRMNGAYRLTGAQGALLCELSFRQDIFGGSGSIKPGPCSPVWAEKALAAWTLRAGRLTLLDKARKTILTLKAGEGGAFTAEDSKGDAVSLVRR
jgi:hypothetical protein